MPKKELELSKKSFELQGAHKKYLFGQIENTIMAIYHHTTRIIGRSGGGNPVKALAYIAGVKLMDERTRELWNFTHKSVDEVHLLLPQNSPAWAIELQKLMNEDRETGLQRLSDLANKSEKRIDGQVYREIEFSLPRELTEEQRKQLAVEYVQDQFCSLGMLAIQNFHTERNEKTGELNPHCHTFFLTRELMEEGLSVKKNREWNERALHENWREQWAQYATFHLKMHGHDITLDHRSYANQGLDIEPQVKLGKGVNEQEKRAQKGLEPDSFSKGQSFVETVPFTDRAQELRSVQLRNLYRILRHPETVFDIVTRYHATFMWGDVQKILGRYVDDVELFQRLDVRLKNSRELLLLKNAEGRDIEGQGEEKSIYTTRSMLVSEKSLVSTAEGLAGNRSHEVSSSSLEHGLERIEARLQEEGYSLSEDQRQAIQHLVEGGQLKCVVGYAGAGKTTALEACREIWENEGYRVYGLAPTGRAAQNLEGSGIHSQTLHKFLKSFEEGRSQYSDKSVLVLDEAGMVDVERFERFLKAVQDLGLKAVVVGDGAQLQPVEAGPAFRLVTERVGVSRLQEVVRQKEDWQREATVLFGAQESQKAIQAYQVRGHIHLVEEKVPEGDRVEEVLSRYEMSARVSGLIFREIMKEIKESSPEKEKNSHYASHTQNASEPRRESQDMSQHQDYAPFLKWRSIQKDAAREILGNADAYRKAMEGRGLDPLELARLFVDKRKDKGSQYKQAGELLKDKGLDHLIGSKRPLKSIIEVRHGAKSALIEDWKKEFQAHPTQNLLMMAYSNKDVRDLNERARDHLKASGVIGREEFTYTIMREFEDDFGRKKAFKGTRTLSKGDRIVFTRNNHGLGVQNGTLGTITEINNQNIKVKIGEDKEVSFVPSLHPYFDQGWAVTIHKSQGTTVDKSFVLASHEMTQNLTYVAMTRHRENVQVYGSTLDFWREEKVADILSKSGEKLGAADYLDSRSLESLMKEEDRFLSRLFTRLGDELHAMGAVSKQAFKDLLDHFFGRSLEKSEPILLKPEVMREEARAQELLRKAPQNEDDARLKAENERVGQEKRRITTLQDVYEDWKLPAFREADFYKRVFEKGLKEYGEQESIQYWNEKREPYIRVFEEKLKAVESELQSPLLSYMSDKSKDLARQSALEDPDRALEFLKQVKASKQAEQLEKEKALQRQQEQEKAIGMKNEKVLEKDDFREAISAYFRFKEITFELGRSPDHALLQEELKEKGKFVFKHKEAFRHIKDIDPEVGKEIKRIALEKQRELDRGLDRGRGGFSL